MYALNSVQSGNGLVKIDLTNGDLIPVCTFSYDRLTEKDQQWDKSLHTLISIAINYDGDMYGVSYSGALYKVNPVTGLCSFIGELTIILTKLTCTTTTVCSSTTRQENYISASSLSMERNLSCPKSI